MAMIQVTAMTAQGEWRDFCLLDGDLEEAYSFLHTIVGRGSTLISVTLMDKQGCLPLPLDGLEEPTFLNPIQPLRQQWEEQLAQPVNDALAKRRLTHQYLRLQEHILELERGLIHFETVRVASRQVYEQSLRFQRNLERRSTLMENYAVNVSRQVKATQMMKNLHQQALHQLSLFEEG